MNIPQRFFCLEMNKYCSHLQLLKLYTKVMTKTVLKFANEFFYINNKRHFSGYSYSLVFILD